MSEKIQLKPCPFCGGTPEKENTDYGECYFISSIRCSECGARIFVKDTVEAAPKAVAEAWNKRADDGTLHNNLKAERKAYGTYVVKIDGESLSYELSDVVMSHNMDCRTVDFYNRDGVMTLSVGFAHIVSIDRTDIDECVNAQGAESLDGIKLLKCDIHPVAQIQKVTMSRADDLRTAAEPLREYLRKYGDPHTSVTVTQDGATVKQDERGVKFRDDELLKRVKNAPLTADGNPPASPALLFEAKFPKSENPVSLKHGTWQETLLRILDTHMARRNSLNVPLQMALPSEVVVSLRNWLLGNAT